MADKSWSVSVSAYSEKASAEAGRTDVVLPGYVVSDGQGPAHGIPGGFYNRLPADGLVAVKGVVLELGSRLSKLGLAGSITGGMSGTISATGAFYDAFDDAIDALQKFGADESKRRGRKFGGKHGKD